MEEIKFIKKIRGSTVLKSSFLYTLFNIINSGLPFLLIPFLTREIDTDGYGKISLITMIVTFLSPVIGLSSASIVAKSYFQVDGRKFSAFIQAAFLILISTTIAPLILLATIDTTNQIFSLNIDLICVCILLSSSQFLISLTCSILQMEEKVFSFGSIQVSQTIVNALFTWYCIVYLKEGWYGRVEGWLISNIIVSFVSIYIIFKKKFFQNFSISKSVIKELLIYCIPIIPYSISGMVISINDRFLVNHFLGNSAVGIYSLALQLSGILNVLFVALNSAYMPWLFRQLSLNKSFEKIVGATYFFAIGITIVGVLLWILLKTFLGVIVGVKFLGISTVLPYFVLSNVLNSFYLILSNFFMYNGQTKVLAKNTFAISIINVPLCYILLKYYSIHGAAFATLITSILMLIINIISINKHIKFPWFKPNFNFK